MHPEQSPPNKTLHDERNIQNNSSNRLFVGGLPIEVTSFQLRNYFSQYGEVLEAKVIKKLFSDLGLIFRGVSRSFTEGVSVDEKLNNN